MKLSAIYTAGNILVRAIGFLLLLVYTRFIPPSEYGMVALAEALAAVLAVISWAMQGSVQRLYFDYSGSERQPRFLAATVAMMGLFMAVILGLGAGAAPAVLRSVAPNFGPQFFPFVLLAVGTVALNQVTEMQMLLETLEHRARRYTLFAIILASGSGLGSLIFVVGLRWGGLGLLIGKLVASVVIASYVAWSWRSWLQAPSFRIMRQLAVVAATLLPYHFLALGLTAADRFILKLYRPLADVGIYSVAYSFGMVMNILVSSVLQAWAPEFYRMATDHEGKPAAAMGTISTALLAGLIGIATFGVAISPGFIRTFLDARYERAAPIVPIIIASLALHAFFALVQLGLRQLHRFTTIVWISAVAFAVNLGLNFALIPRYGLYGAAWATLAGYAVEAVLCMAMSQRLYPIPLQWSKLAFALAVLASALVMTVAGIPHSGWWLSGLVAISALMLKKYIMLAVRSLLGSNQVPPGPA
ncbi:MAG: lipopolysaccharide biosynthesis protein [Terriglobales bacterium]